MMSEVKIKPCGYYVLIQMDPVSRKSESGIIMRSDKEKERESLANSTGKVLAFGPAAFQGLANGVNSPDEWGVAVGDQVEFTSYDGKVPKSDEVLDEDGKNLLRLIQDQHIIAKVGRG